MQEHGEPHPRRRMLRRRGSRSAPPQTRGRGSTPSAGPLSPRRTAGPPELRSRSLHGGRRSGTLEGSPRPFTVGLGDIRRAQAPDRVFPSAAMKPPPPPQDRRSTEVGS
ncbi:hypothetical protein NDU88_005904 [Pleurodeles waltl]|uniref:Uncharacterized protein n=1 Tax=Pleurodeles waltl TaxID=8319 RepID=A0AAV7RN46_PLEWA|nr:hypothetical protein NDU88_005904 [Pleurodeles waltl]